MNERKRGENAHSLGTERSKAAGNPIRAYGKPCAAQELKRTGVSCDTPAFHHIKSGQHRWLLRLLQQPWQQQDPHAYQKQQG